MFLFERVFPHFVLNKLGILLCEQKVGIQQDAALKIVTEAPLMYVKFPSQRRSWWSENRTGKRNLVLTGKKDDDT